MTTVKEDLHHKTKIKTAKTKTISKSFIQSLRTVQLFFQSSMNENPIQLKINKTKLGIKENDTICTKVEDICLRYLIFIRNIIYLRY